MSTTEELRGLIPEGRRGAGDEDSGSDSEGHGEEDHLVAGSGDHRGHATGQCGGGRSGYEEHGYDGLFDRRKGKPSPKRVPREDRGAGAGAVPGEVLRLQRAALSREAAGGAPDRFELHLGEAGAAGGGSGKEGGAAGRASQAAAAAAAAGHAAAPGRQPAPVVPGRALVRPAGDPGRRDQRDLLRAVGGGGIDADGDGGDPGGGGAQGRVLRDVHATARAISL